MFGRWFVARVGLPREVWEPLRVLHFEHGMEVGELAEAYGVSVVVVGRVLLLAQAEFVHRFGSVPQISPHDVGECFDAVPRSRNALTTS